MKKREMFGSGRVMNTLLTRLDPSLLRLSLLRYYRALLFRSVLLIECLKQAT